MLEDSLRLSCSEGLFHDVNGWSRQDNQNECLDGKSAIPSEAAVGAVAGGGLCAAPSCDPGDPFSCTGVDALFWGDPVGGIEGGCDGRSASGGDFECMKGFPLDPIYDWKPEISADQGGTYFCCVVDAYGHQHCHGLNERSCSDVLPPPPEEPPETPT